MHRYRIKRQDIISLLNIFYKFVINCAFPAHLTDNKSIVTALREIAAGLVRFKTPEECQADRLKAASEEKTKVSELLRDSKFSCTFAH